MADRVEELRLRRNALAHEVDAFATEGEWQRVFQTVKMIWPQAAEDRKLRSEDYDEGDED